MKKNFLISITLTHKEKIDFTKYPFNITAIKNLKELAFHPNVTFIVGENGSGKSTLLEALAINQRFNPEGGSKNFTFHTNNSHSNLYKYIKVIRSTKKLKDGFFLRAESFYNLATNIDELEKIDSGILKSYGNRSLHKQSHGESFFSLMQNRFGDNGLYILDEPEAALSPQKQMSMLVLIHKLVDKGSQFIISTHSPILLSYPNARIYEINETSGINKVSYEETDTYMITRDFLNHYKKFQKNIGIAR